MNRIIVPTLFNLILIFLCPLCSDATGPSHAEISIVPIACNDENLILFKTYSYINRMGGGFPGAQYGWLIVSADGIWDELLHLKIAKNDFEAWENAKDEFNKDLNWKSPPKSLQSIINKYGFNSNHVIDPHEGEDTINWTPSIMCHRNSCTKKPIKQRSLGELLSHESEGNRIQASFFYCGIALFKNILEFDLDDSIKLTGAYFHIPNVITGEDVGIDIWQIDGVSIVKETELK